TLTSSLHDVPIRAEWLQCGATQGRAATAQSRYAAKRFASVTNFVRQCTSRAPPYFSFLGIAGLSAARRASPANWYDYPQYFDLAFSDETIAEANFFEQAIARYAQRPIQRWLEPGFGRGRLVVEMARRGYDLVAFDNN